MRGDNWIEPLLAAEANVAHFQIDGADQVAEAVQRCAAVGANVIVVNGGDGTAGLVFAALLNGNAYPNLPALALLPAGKTNMTAAGWSLKGTAEAAMAAVLRERREGGLARHAVNRPVLALYQNENAPPRYGAFFGAAEIVEGIWFCRKHIYPLRLPIAVSHTAATALLLWRGLRAATSGSDISIHDGENEIENGSFFVVAVTALDEILLGVRPDAAVRRSASAPLHYMSLRAGPRAILGAIPNLARRRFAPGEGRTVRRLERVTLNFTGPYTLDGEIYAAVAGHPLVLDGSRCLDFIQIPS